MVAENRQKALEEVSTRMESWRNVMQSPPRPRKPGVPKNHGSNQGNRRSALGKHSRYRNRRLRNSGGLQRRQNQFRWMLYTQSGGERTTATMSFLLALQQHVRSPFRAVDEYDIHMDPRNREMIAKILISTASKTPTPNTSSSRQAK